MISGVITLRNDLSSYNVIIPIVDVVKSGLVSGIVSFVRAV